MGWKTPSGIGLSLFSSLDDIHPDWEGEGGAVAAGADRARLVEPDPDAACQTRIKAEEPRVHEVVRRAGFPGGPPAEAEFAGASPGPPLDDLFEQRGCLADSGRLKNVKPSMRRLVEQAAFGIGDAFDQIRLEFCEQLGSVIFYCIHRGSLIPHRCQWERCRSLG